MVLYKCPRCGYTAIKKDHIRNHINKKKICRNVLSDVIPKKIEEEILSSSVKINPLDEVVDKLRREVNRLREENSSLKAKISKCSGYIYVLHNSDFSSWGDNVYKIGCSNNPERRLKDLSTSYRSESRIIYKSNLFPDKLEAEKKLFRQIKKYRLSKREFFDIPKEVLIEYIENLD